MHSLRLGHGLRRGRSGLRRLSFGLVLASRFCELVCCAPPPYGNDHASRLSLNDNLQPQPTLFHSCPSTKCSQGEYALNKSSSYCETCRSPWTTLSLGSTYCDAAVKQHFLADWSHEKKIEHYEEKFGLDCSVSTDQPHLAACRPDPHGWVFREGVTVANMELKDGWVGRVAPLPSHLKCAYM